MPDPRIQIAQDLAKIKGMENSLCVIRIENLEDKSIVRDILERKHPAIRASAIFSEGVFPAFTILPYLRLAYEDGKWSSASIREGLDIEITYDYYPNAKVWELIYEDPKIEDPCDSEVVIKLSLTDPSADELAMQLGIIEYWKQYPKEVEDYLEGLK